MNPVEARLAELAGRWSLDGGVIDHARTLLALWAEDELASTTVTAPVEAVDQHLADAWVALQVDELRAATKIADLGTGAGIPALPLAIALPQAQVALVESVGRRTVFLERALAACDLAERCSIVVRRAEGWPEGIGEHDVITSRALASLDVVLEYSAPLLREGGIALAWKGALSEEERADGVFAAGELGMEMEQELEVEPFVGARHRRLIIARKVAPTPERFPRREGMARKKPLGARRPK